MASVNKVILLGNLGRDPETRYTTGGDAVTNLNIATSEQWKDKSGEKQERTDNTLPATGEYLGDLSFDYELSGSASWKPVRVYNDGRKTIIEMPGTMQQTEAPTLLVVRKEGGLFTDDETVLVNYRVQGNRYIVDTVFDRAILIAGVGSSQDRVTISRRK